MYQDREALLKDKRIKAVMQVAIKEKLSMHGCLESDRFAIITVDMYTGTVLQNSYGVLPADSRQRLRYF